MNKPGTNDIWIVRGRRTPSAFNRRTASIYLIITYMHNLQAVVKYSEEIYQQKNTLWMESLQTILNITSNAKLKKTRLLDTDALHILSTSCINVPIAVHNRFKRITFPTFLYDKQVHTTHIFLRMHRNILSLQTVKIHTLQNVNYHGQITKCLLKYIYKRNASLKRNEYHRKDWDDVHVGVKKNRCESRVSSFPTQNHHWFALFELLNDNNTVYQLIN